AFSRTVKYNIGSQGDQKVAEEEAEHHPCPAAAASGLFRLLSRCANGQCEPVKIQECDQRTCRETETNSRPKPGPCHRGESQGKNRHEQHETAEDSGIKSFSALCLRLRYGLDVHSLKSSERAMRMKYTSPAMLPSTKPPSGSHPHPSQRCRSWPTIQPIRVAAGMVRPIWMYFSALTHIFFGLRSSGISAILRRPAL